MEIKKVLIYGQTFNDFSGGGITLTNLFKDWPGEALAVISYPFMLHNSSSDVCQNYYQIGREELTWKFPFSLVKQQFTSGRVEIRAGARLPVLKGSRSIRHSISSNFLSPTIKWLGLIHCISTIHLSQKSKEWISTFNPDILYFQISNRESIRFAIELIDYLKIPSVIHMMDDWPSTISSRGPFKAYWQKRIDQDFRLLLDKTNIHLSISDLMSKEYLRRYGKKFIPFHNPVDPEAINSQTPVNKPRGKQFKVLYLGRVGTANKRSIRSFARFVSKYKPDDIEVEFDIYTKDINTHFVRGLGRKERVNISGSLDHSEIQLYMRRYDLLLLPLDFTSAGLKFSRLSIPTKASEYMISGTPILVLAPPQTAVSKFFLEHECGYCVVSDDFKSLDTAMSLLIGNENYRVDLGRKAIDHATRLFSGAAIRRSFSNLLLSLLQ